MSLLGFGLSLFSGLSARSDAIKTHEYEKQAYWEHEQRMMAATRHAEATPEVNTMRGNLSEMVQASEAAGFNPLSVLRAGGLSAFNTLTRTGHNALGLAQLSLSIGPQPVAHIPSVGSVFANSALQTYNQMQNTLSSGSGGLPGGLGGYAPAVARTFSSPPPQTSGGSRSSGALAGAMNPRTGMFGVDGEFTGRVQPQFESEIEAQNPHSDPRIRLDPFNRPSEAWENMYSDPGGWVGAAINAKNNFLYTYTGRHSGDRAEAAAQNQAIWESFWGGFRWSSPNDPSRPYNPSDSLGVP